MLEDDLKKVFTGKRVADVLGRFREMDHKSRISTVVNTTREVYVVLSDNSRVKMEKTEVPYFYETRVEENLLEESYRISYLDDSGKLITKIDPYSFRSTLSDFDIYLFKEGDLIKGKFNRSSVGTLVERTMLFTVLAKMDGNGAKAAVEGFSQVLNCIDAQHRLSMTYDNGCEMARHEEITARTGVKVYFADPHSPWQRGINENTNGLLCQYLPQGEDLSVHSQEDLDKIAGMLNIRPRKTLGWKCPAELFLPDFDFVAYMRRVFPVKKSIHSSPQS